MKRLIGFSAALAMSASMAQAMTRHDVAIPVIPDRFAILATSAIADLLPQEASAWSGQAVQLAGRRGSRARPARQPGGHSQGAQRAKRRSHDVDRDVDLDIDDGRDHIIDDDALRGAAIGVGIGTAIANSDDPDYTCPDEDQNGVCDDNPAN